MSETNRDPSPIRPSRAAIFLLGCLALAIPGSGSDATPSGVSNRYIGVARCKSCHGTRKTGNQYRKWAQARHSQAFALLATDRAKMVGREHGVQDPQASGECLRCHTTAFGKPADMIRKGFDRARGVQCESCHGPGEKHMTARLAAANSAGEEELGEDAEPRRAQVAEGEIISDPRPQTCLTCHGKENPTFERFCYYELVPKVRHLNPQKQRSAEQLAALLVCGCPDPCECVDGCPDDGCGVPPRGDGESDE